MYGYHNSMSSTPFALMIAIFIDLSPVDFPLAYRLRQIAAATVVNNAGAVSVLRQQAVILLISRL